MTEYILNADLCGLILSPVLGLVKLSSFRVAPDMWVGDYLPAIKEKCGETGACAC